LVGQKMDADMKKAIVLVLVLAVASAIYWRDEVVAATTPYVTSALSLVGYSKTPPATDQTGAPGATAGGNAAAGAHQGHQRDQAGGAASSAPGQSAAPAGTAARQGSGGGRRGSGGPTRVATVAATAEDMPVLRRTLGTVASPASLLVTSETQGIVTEILVADGATVKKGDPLVRLDNRVAEATVEKDKVALARDQASLAHAVATAERQKRLLSNDAVSQQSLEDSQAAVQIAQATVDLDQAVLKADLVTLAQKEIRAPFDGRLGAFSIVVGSYIQPQSAVVRLTQLDPLLASFSLPESDAELVRKALTAGDTLSVEVSPLGGDQTYPGAITFVDTVVDQASGSFVAKATLNEFSDRLMPGQSIAVTVSIGSKQVVAVPTVALQSTQGGTVVYTVAADGTVAVKPVTIALAAGDHSGLDSGLAAGDRVIVEGQANLAAGMKVIDTSTAAKADTPARTADAAPEVKP